MRSYYGHVSSKSLEMTNLNNQKPCCSHSTINSCSLPKTTICIQNVNVDVLLREPSIPRSLLVFLLAKERPNCRQGDHENCCCSFHELPEEYPYRIRGVIRERRIRDADDGDDDHENGKT